MTENNPTQPKALTPRRLDQQESLQSLNQWKAVFRNYYRRCPYYGYFLLNTTTWDVTATRGFITAEPTGLKRDPETLRADLDGFLDCVGSFTPFDYLGDKLKAESTGIESVWGILYETYDVELTTTNFMDYATMRREPEESYRSFYNRLVGFMRQHLPKEAVTAEGVVSPPTGENLSVALLDAVAIHWLLCIDHRLIGIVKTEFSTELKTLRLSQMVKTIAKNIDELLVRYGSKEQINMVSSPAQSVVNLPSLPSHQNDDIGALIQRVQRLESNNKRQNRKQVRWSNVKRDQCSHCLFLNKQLGSNLKTDHPASMCGKRQVSVSLIESLDADICSDNPSDPSEYEGCSDTNLPPLISSLQTAEAFNSVANQTSNSCAIARENKFICRTQHHSTTGFDMPAVSDRGKYSAETFDCSYPHYPASPETSVTGIGKTCHCSNNFPILASLQSQSTYSWNKIEKSLCPRIRCQYNNKTFSVLIDSGAEVNALDLNFAESLQIGINKTNESACAASKLPLQVCGQSRGPITIKCLTDNGHTMLYLGVVLIIANLGTSCLLGEPAKRRNNIICLPKQRIVVIAKDEDVHYVPYDEGTPKHSLIRALSNQILAPGDQLEYILPDHLNMETSVCVTPRISSISWLKPSIATPSNGTIYLVNSSEHPISIQKTDHIADVRDLSTADYPIKPISGKAVHDDKFQFRDFAVSRTIKPEYLNDIQLDPDNILNQEQKNMFQKLNQRFASLFTPQPGRYNGSWGYIDNHLQFATPPPPNIRTRIPNYSPPMNAILAEKMDTLESWGILAEPETMGVSVEFISPSMLVPKPEKNEYRLVTDFSALNVFLKKVPNTLFFL